MTIAKVLAVYKTAPLVLIVESGISDRSLTIESCDRTAQGGEAWSSGPS